jgi:ATP-dependent helicase Lhr and Lhr-like helicase
VRTLATMGRAADEEALAEAISNQWLVRYGVVSRDWWKRERPAVSWRAIYSVLRRAEYRGEVRRGYFVDGLAGAQFATPQAVEELRRDAGAGGSGGAVVMAATDPANVFPLLASAGLERPRGRGALLVMRAGVVEMAVEGRGRAVRIRPELAEADVARAARALAEYLGRDVPGRKMRDLVVETIDGEQSGASSHVQAFLMAGFARSGNQLRLYAGVR